MPARPLPIKTAYYPESDGKPMGETDWHRKAIIRLIELLERHFAGQKVYVSGDLLVYYEQGNPKKFVAPDVFVVKGLQPKDRRIYEMWIERKAPDAIIEVTSLKTRKKDAIDKPQLYARFGVKEYFLFDPDADYLEPALQGYRLDEAAYDRILPDADGGLTCQSLELRLKLDDTGLIPFTYEGRRLLTGIEEAARAQREADQLAEENRQLREELARRKSSE
jgi:Uma2 family endonuclease